MTILESPQNTKRSFAVENKGESPKFYEVHKHAKKFFDYMLKPQALEVEREEIISLRHRIEKGLLLEGVDADIEYGVLSDLYSKESGNIIKDVDIRGLGDEEIASTIKNTEAYIDNGEQLRVLKEKVKSFYERADEETREKFESMLKSVEHVMETTNVFIVHLFLFDEKRDSDIDTILSLQPSILTSSVVPGTKQGLPQGKSGLVLSGGDITSMEDTETVSENAEYSHETITGYKEICKRIADKNTRTYNEIIVKNPEVFGFFLNVNVGDSGELYDFRTSVTEDAKRFKDDFMKNMILAASKGFPQLVMTPDRRMFEFRSIDDDGTVHVGEEITPESIAQKKVIVTPEKKKAIYTSMLQRNIM